MESAGGLLLVALCWGFTNPFIKAGSTGVEQVSKRYAHEKWYIRLIHENLYLFTRWQYILPLAVNLSGSTVFYYTLGHSNLSMIVPITNSLTFAFTVLSGTLLGEKIGSQDTMLGIALVFIGVLLMVS